MKRLPAVPLHPHVYEVALAQLESGARYVSYPHSNTLALNIGAALHRSNPPISS